MLKSFNTLKWLLESTVKGYNQNTNFFPELHEYLKYITLIHYSWRRIDKTTIILGI